MGMGGWSLGRFNAKLFVVFVVVIAGLAAWLALPELSDAQNDSVVSPSASGGSTQNAVRLEAATISEPAPEATPADEPAAVTAAPPTEAATASPLDGLRISSQSWRRGGLGSKALVTLTLRNANDYAVKDIEIACAFTRRDGSHLTDRKRVISDIINMKSRKTYAGMLVGFVNINANKAKCSLVTASRI
jgi:hypothetical protein